MNSVLLNFSNVDAWRTWAVGILSFKRSGRKFIISDGRLIKAASNPLKVAGNPADPKRAQIGALASFKK